MNKKLFSWKALAGLALLVAMGLTSCQQDNAVQFDENGNYVVPEKPVTPTATGTNLKGFKTCAELSNLIATTKAITDNIGAGKTVTITADCSNLEVAPASYQVIIPGAADATINLELTGTFKTKDGAVLEINDQALDNVNLTLTKGDYVLNMPYSTISLAGTVGTLKTMTSNNTLRPITLKSGAVVENLDWSTGNIVVSDGAAINGYVAKADVNVTKDGIQLASVNNAAGKSYFIKNVLVAADATVYAWNYTDAWAPIYALNTVYVAGGITATISGFVENVVGLGKDRSSKAISINTVNGKISNITLPNYEWTASGAAVDNVTFKAGAELYGAASNSTFEDNIWVYIPGLDVNTSFKYTFDKCTFATTSRIYAGWWANKSQKPVLDADGNQVIETYYYYWDENGNYFEAKTEQEFSEDVRKKYDITKGTRKLFYQPSPNYDKDFVATVAVNDCKVGTAAYTKDSDTSLLSSFTSNGDGATAKATVAYEINGKAYKLVKIYDQWNNLIGSKWME